MGEKRRLMVESQPYYELHITYLDTEDGDQPPIVPGWFHSCISGDIDAGDGVSHYLTKHAKPDSGIDALVAEMDEVAGELRRMGLEVVRTKVESIVYDRRAL